MSQFPFAYRPGVTPPVLPLDGKTSEQWIPRGELTVQHMLLLHPPAAAAAAAASPSSSSTLPEPRSPVPEVPAELFWLKDSSGLSSQEAVAEKSGGESRGVVPVATRTRTHRHTRRVRVPRKEFRKCWEAASKACPAPEGNFLRRGHGRGFYGKREGPSSQPHRREVRLCLQQ